MNNKTTKIAILALSAFLLIACCFGIGVMAEENESPKVEILFNNLEYGDNISILYAVNVDGADKYDLRLDFYTEADGAYVFDHSTSAYEMQDVKINGVTEKYPVFKSPGIAPKHMTEIVYAQATLTVDGVEYKSNLSRFSITEYCYKRLYKDTNATDDQKALYNHVLGFGTYAQKVLGYDVENTPADYFYVNAEGAVVDSVTINDKKYDFSAGIFKAGKAMTLAYTGNAADGYYAEWKLAYTDALGNVTAGTLADKSEFTVDKHIVANTAMRFGGIKFDNGVISDFITTTPSENSALSVTVADAPAAKQDGDKALKIHPLGTGTTRIDLMDGAEGDCYVFEADIYYAQQDVFDGFAIFKFYNENDALISETTYTHVGGTNSTRYWRMMARSGGANNFAYFGGGDFANEWWNYRIELYFKDGKWIAQYFIDDVFVFEDLSLNKKTDGTALGYLDISHSTRDFVYYLDNIKFERTTKAYSATPETAAPALNGTTGTGVYYSESSKNASGYRVYDFNLDFSDSGNGRYNDDDVAPRVDTNKGAINGYNANGYGLLVKETEANHSSIKYSMPTIPKNDGKTYKAIVEMDLAISDPSISLPVVIGTIAQETAGSFYFSYDSAKNQMYVTDFTNKVAYFNLDEWHNFRFEITRTINDDGTIKVKADVYFDGAFVGTVSGLDVAARKGYGDQINIQLRNTDGTVKVSYDNLVLTYAEVTE